MFLKLKMDHLKTIALVMDFSNPSKYSWNLFAQGDIATRAKLINHQEVELILFLHKKHSTNSSSQNCPRI